MVLPSQLTILAIGTVSKGWVSFDCTVPNDKNSIWDGMNYHDLTINMALPLVWSRNHTVPIVDFLVWDGIPNKPHSIQYRPNCLKLRLGRYLPPLPTIFHFPHFCRYLKRHKLAFRATKYRQYFTFCIFVGIQRLVITDFIPTKLRFQDFCRSTKKNPFQLHT